MQAVDFRRNINILNSYKILKHGEKFGIDVNGDGQIERADGDYTVTMYHKELGRLAARRDTEVLLGETTAGAYGKTRSFASVDVPLDDIVTRMHPLLKNATWAIIVARDPATKKPTDDMEFVIYQPKSDAP